MTIYARSDVMSVALSAAHGGCGAAHSRPVTHGAPAKVWALDCPPCENHLRSDPLWAVMPADLPETPDEVRVREDQEKRGSRDRESQLVDAILAIANSHEKLPDQLAAALATAGSMIPAITDTVRCPEGHENTALAKFCGECGRRMDEPPIANDDEPAVPHLGAPKLDLSPADLVRMSVPDLRALATKHGIDATGTKADLIARMVG
jgi:hypothetical protein